MSRVYYIDESTLINENGWFKFDVISSFDSYGYHVEIKVYDQPSEYGIQGGRISKLEIVDNRYPRKEYGWEGVRVSYDRNWDISLTLQTPDPLCVKDVYFLVVDLFNYDPSAYEERN